MQEFNPVKPEIGKPYWYIQFDTAGPTVERTVYTGQDLNIFFEFNYFPDQEEAIIVKNRMKGDWYRARIETNNIYQSKQ